MGLLPRWRRQLSPPLLSLLPLPLPLPLLLMLMLLSPSRWRQASRGCAEINRDFSRHRRRASRLASACRGLFSPRSGLWGRAAVQQSSAVPTRQRTAARKCNRVRVTRGPKRGPTVRQRLVSRRVWPLGGGGGGGGASNGRRNSICAWRLKSIESIGIGIGSGRGQCD